MRAPADRAVPTDSDVQELPTKGEELRSFLFLTIVMAPVLTFLLVAAYGFAVWMFQLLSGPPTGG